MTTLSFEKDLPSVLTKAESLPSLPAVALEVLRLTQDEETTIDDLAECIGRDPALAAKLLKLSNSSLFSMGREITTLQRAMMILGMKTVKLMSLSFSLASSFPKDGAQAGFDLDEYWRRSLVSAVAARSLAQRVESPEGDEAFLCGLLGHFGRLVLAGVMAESYEEVVTRCNGWPTHAEEERSLGFSSADVCATLMKSWELPAVIYMAVGYSTRADELGADADPLVVDLVHLLEATGYAESVLCDEDKGPALQKLYARAREHYGLEEHQVEEFLVGLEHAIAETAEMLSIELPAGKSHEDIMNEARVQIMEVSLGTAADLRHSQREQERLEQEKLELQHAARTDKLTGLPNRAAFDDFLESQIAARARGKLPRGLGLVMIDVDRFKSFNDTYGHAVGDEVLRMIGSVLRRETRKGDLAARFGGEEFALVAPHTNTFGLRTVAERLRKAIEAESLEIDGQVLGVTASFGAACISEFGSTEQAGALIKLADHHLYKAKEKGRNRCEVYTKMRFPGR